MKITLAEMFNTLNTKSIVMVLPTMHQAPLTLISLWLQRCFVEMVTHSYFNDWKDDDWILGLVFNIHRLLMRETGKEQILEGVNMAAQPFMQVLSGHVHRTSPS